MSNSSDTKRTIYVWDPIVRVSHWTLASCVIIAFFTHKGPEWLHFLTGYIAFIVAILRTIIGFFGSHYARFREFIKTPDFLVSYAVDLLNNRETHFIGHNPLGGYMILLLLFTVMIVGMTGSLLDTDSLFGNELIEDTHSFFSYLFIPLIGLHIIGVIFTSIRQKENLIYAMITGKKRNHSETRF